MSSTAPSLQKPLRNEAILLTACLVFGLFLLPAAIYLVGNLLFGTFGGGSLADFYGSVQAAIWQFDPVVWFLVVSPYLVVQSLRWTIRIYGAMRNS